MLFASWSRIDSWSRSLLPWSPDSILPAPFLCLRSLWAAWSASTLPRSRSFSFSSSCRILVWWVVPCSRAFRASLVSSSSRLLLDSSSCFNIWNGKHSKYDSSHFNTYRGGEYAGMHPTLGRASLLIPLPKPRPLRSRN